MIYCEENAKHSPRSSTELSTAVFFGDAMPYGSGVTDFDQPDFHVNMTNYYPGGSKLYSYTWGLSSLRKYSWSRSGQNRSSRLIAEKPAGGPFVEKVFVHYTGPRLPYKVFNPKISRYVWARQPIRSTRLIRVKSRKGVNSVVSDQPNPLNFFCQTVSPYGDREVIARYDSQWYRKFEGDLYFNNYPIGYGVAVPPSFQTFTVPSFLVGLESAETSADASALSKLYEKAKNQSINLAQVFGERRQTTRMLADTVVRLASAVAAAKRGNLAKAAKKIFPSSSKALANDYLMWTYGVKPLLSDIDGAAKHLAQPENKTFKVYGKRKIEVPLQTIATGSGGSGVAQQTTVTMFGSVEVTYEAKFTVSQTGIRELNRLGISNPLSLGWELLPWSFVVDWFLPIGNYLNSLDAFNGLTLNWVRKTVVKRQTVVFNRNFGGNGGDGYIWPSKNCGLVIEKVSCVRSVPSIVPPCPLPIFKDPISKGHIANAIALLRQLKK